MNISVTYVLCSANCNEYGNNRCSKTTINGELSVKVALWQPHISQIEHVPIESNQPLDAAVSNSYAVEGLVMRSFQLIF